MPAREYYHGICLFAAAKMADADMRTTKRILDESDERVSTCKPANLHMSGVYILGSFGRDRSVPSRV